MFIISIQNLVFLCKEFAWAYPIKKDKKILHIAKRPGVYAVRPIGAFTYSTKISAYLRRFHY